MRFIIEKVDGEAVRTHREFFTPFATRPKPR